MSAGDRKGRPYGGTNMVPCPRAAGGVGPYELLPVACCLLPNAYLCALWFRCFSIRAMASVTGPLQPCSLRPLRQASTP